MGRYLAGGVATLAMVGAGVLVFGRPQATAVLPPAPAAAAAAAASSQGDMPEAGAVPEATPRTREEKRFGRYDKDRNGAITRDEYLAARRKAYAKLDADKDGTLSFDEWSAKTQAKFAGADRDRSGSMNAAEFATTAVKRKPARRTACPPAAPAEEG